jgi:DNA-binding SARP family transcriptional activator
VGILAQLTWKVIKATYHYLNSKEAVAVDIANKGLDIATKSGVHHLDLLLYAQATYGHLTNYDVKSARLELERMSALLNNTATFDFAHYHYLMCWTLLCEGNPNVAVEHGKTSVEAANRVGASNYPAFAGLTYAQALFESGQREQAFELLDHLRDWGQRVGNSFVEAHYLFVRALHALDNREMKQCAESLTAGLTLCKAKHYTMLPWIGWRKPLLTRLLVQALRDNIETTYVRGLIKHRGLLLPENETIPDNWPFEIKVYTLGRFSLLVDDTVQELSGKGAARPLELLKCLIAFGGRQVSQENLIEALWPDTDGDSGAKAFHTTLYRLRKILQHDEAIVLKDAKLSLDTRYVWLDAWSLERVSSEIEHSVTQGADPERVDRLTQAFLKLHKGSFLGTGTDESWALAYRERMQLRTLRLLSVLGDFWRQQGQAEHAIAMYERLLEIDRLHEPAYQHLMHVYLNQGRQAEAAATYERCRKILSATLGVMPSARTLEIFKQIPVI